MTEPEDWWLICPRCGRAVRAVDVGYVRVHARSKGKRMLGRCRECTKLRWLRVEAAAPGTVPPGARPVDPPA